MAANSRHGDPVDRRRRRGAAAERFGPCLATLVAAVASWSTACRADAPLAYLTGAGTKSYAVVYLLWGLLAISVLVVTIVGVLLLMGILRRRATPAPRDLRLVPVQRAEGGLRSLYIGTAVSAAALFGSALWTFSVLGAISGPPEQSKLAIHVIGHQWWWEVHYDSDDVSRTFSTANELHIPTGQPVSVTLDSTDVIHSFWVPQLTGKMDTIPGQHNVTWLEADTPGTYRGQCTEYCGLQHAHMGLLVIADPPQKFDAWWAAQLEPPAPPASAAVADGQAQFMAHCAVCHTVRGTDAGGRLGPDLSHLMNRRTIGAATLSNTPGGLSGWIADPQHIKPGNLMPNLDMSGPQLAAVRQYLETLH